MGGYEKNKSIDEERKGFKVADKAGIERAPSKRKPLPCAGISEKVPQGQVLTHHRSNSFERSESKLRRPLKWFPDFKNHSGHSLSKASKASSIYCPRLA